MKYSRLTASLLFVIAIVWSSMAKDVKISLSETLLYVGQANKNIPSGQGTLYVLKQPDKNNLDGSDVVSGLFDGNRVVSAEMRLSNGWHFQGDLTYSVKTGSERYFYAEVLYNMTGKLISDDGNNVYYVEDLDIKRYTDTEHLYSMDTVFLCKRDAVSGGQVTQVASLINYEEDWHINSYLVLNPNLVFCGGEVDKVPHGQGKMMFGPSNSIDTIYGNFDNMSVKDARIAFDSGWSFAGDMKYRPIKLPDNSYGMKYLLNGVLTLKDEATRQERKWDVQDLSIERSISNNWIELKDFIIKETRIGKVSNPLYVRIASAERAKEVINYRVVQSRWKSWDIIREGKEIIFENGYTVKEDGKGSVIISNPNGDLLSLDRDKLTGMIKTFPEGVFQSNKIYYNNGDTYEGEYSINELRVGRSINSGGLYDRMAELMRTDAFLAEIPIMYINGVHTYSNGKSDKWKDGITDYQQNKINGNYEKASAAISKYRAEQNAAEGKKLEEKWQASLPELRRRYGSRYVDDLYNYRLYYGIPLGLFVELGQRGLVRLIGPLVQPGASFKQYIIFVTNRTTGEIQYSQVLTFEQPPRSSQWYLARYSSNF